MQSGSFPCENIWLAPTECSIITSIDMTPDLCFFLFSDSSCLLTAKNDLLALVCSSLESNGYLYGVVFSL